MSYASIGDDSDVYVFLSVAGRRFVCCGLGHGHPDEPGYSLDEFKSTAAIIRHLEGHVALGHRVPGRAFERLRAQQVENDQWIKRPGRRAKTQEPM